MRFVPAVIAFLLLAAPAHAADQIEGTWTFDGGEVLVEATAPGVFKGTVVKPTSFSACEHQVGERMWELNATTDPTRYEGGHNWFNPECRIVARRGPSQWVITSVDAVAYTLQFCTVSADAAPGADPYCQTLRRLRERLPTPTFTQSVVMPTARAKRTCSSRRSFRIRLRQNRRDPLVRATVRINGRLVKTVGRDRITAPVNLRGLPKGRYTVAIRAVTATGKVIRGKRTYRTCTKRR